MHTCTKMRCSDAFWVQGRVRRCSFIWLHMCCVNCDFPLPVLGVRLHMNCANRAVSVPVFGRAASYALCKPSCLGACFWAYACGFICIVQTELFRCLFWVCGFIYMYCANRAVSVHMKPHAHIRHRNSAVYTINFELEPRAQNRHTNQCSV